jgi:flagellar biosynthesis regulator FlaF
VFLGGLSFFLAIVSIGILIYTMVQIIQKNRSEEGQGLIRGQMGSD